MVDNIDYLYNLTKKNLDQGLTADEYRNLTSLKDQFSLKVNYKEFLNNQNIEYFDCLDEKLEENENEERLQCKIFLKKNDINEVFLNELLDELYSFNVSELLKLPNSLFFSTTIQDDYKLCIFFKIQNDFKEYMLMHILKNIINLLKFGRDIELIKTINVIDCFNIELRD